MFRIYIRESKLLENPYEQFSLRSIDNEELHPDFVNFYFQCLENYNAYKINPESDLPPVFVSYEEEQIHNDINNWSISKIQKECEKVINSFSNEEMTTNFLSIFKKMKKPKKAQIIQFYLNVMDEAKRQQNE